MNKVIFIDVESVICSLRSSTAYGGYPSPDKARTWAKFDPVAVAMLKAAMKETGASIVICCEWRDHANIETLEYVLGIDDIEVTRSAVPSEIRGDQIYDWLVAHPEVERYAILDDKEDYHPAQLDKLCRTSHRNGFLLGHYEELVEVLGVLQHQTSAPVVTMAAEEDDGLLASE